MQKSCAVCGNSFEAKRARAMYCSGRCQKRAQRQPAAEPRPSIADKKADIPQTSLPAGPFSGIAVATAAKLEAAGRLDTPEGQAALMLAYRVDVGMAETGSAIASLVRQFHATLAAALDGAQAEMDEVDELRARRERKLAG